MPEPKPTPEPKPEPKHKLVVLKGKQASVGGETFSEGMVFHAETGAAIFHVEYESARPYFPPLDDRNGDG